MGLTRSTSPAQDCVESPNARASYNGDDWLEVGSMAAVNARLLLTGPSSTRSMMRFIPASRW